MSASRFLCRRSLAATCLLAVMAAIASPRPEALAQDVEQRLQRIRDSLESGRIDRAEKEAAKALEEAPSNPDVHRVLCDIRKVQSRRDEAISECRRAAELAPARGDLHVDLGDLLSQREDGIEDALRAYEKAAAADPNNPRPHLSIGGLYERRGRLQEAEAEYREAIALNPNTAQANAGLGAVLFNTGRPGEARTYLLRAIELRPRDLRSHIFLGLSLNHDGQFDLAIQELRAAAGIDPFAANQVAGVDRLRDRFEHLRELFTTQLASQPSDSRLHNSLGVLAYYLHDYETAWRQITKAQQLGYPVDQGLKEVVYSRWKGLSRRS